MRDIGTIKKRMSGIYRFQAMINGKRFNYSLKTKDRKEAEKRAEELRATLAINDRDALIDKVVREKARVTEDVELTEAVEKFSARADCSRETLRSYRSRFRVFRAWVKENYPGATHVGQVTEAIGREFLDHIWSTNVAGGTYNKYAHALKMIFAFFRGEKWVLLNPFERAKSRRSAPETRREFTETQLAAIFAAVDDPACPVQFRDEYRLLLRIGAWTGLRLKDACLLRWRDVALDRGVISVVPYKIARRTNKRVIIPLHADLRARLERDAAGWRRPESEYVLPNIAENYISNASNNNSGPGQTVGRILKRAGIETNVRRDAGAHRKIAVNEYGFHSFRHTFVSFCAAAGVSAAVVQEIVGHNCPAMTRHYTHTGLDAARQAIAALPGGGAAAGTRSDALADVERAVRDALVAGMDPGEILERVKNSLG